MPPSFKALFAGAIMAALPFVSAQRTTGFIGCSMAENVATGYVAVGGQTLWAPYGTGGAVVQSWTDNNSASWQSFDRVAAQNGKPDTVWVQICIFSSAGATYQEVTQLIANARSHAAPDAKILISGQPLYNNLQKLLGILLRPAYSRPESLLHDPYEGLCGYGLLVYRTFIQCVQNLFQARCH